MLCGTSWRPRAVHLACTLAWGAACACSFGFSSTQLLILGGFIFREPIADLLSHANRFSALLDAARRGHLYDIIT